MKCITLIIVCYSVLPGNLESHISHIPPIKIVANKSPLNTLQLYLVIQIINATEEPPFRLMYKHVVIKQHSDLLDK